MNSYTKYRKVSKFRKQCKDVTDDKIVIILKELSRSADELNHFGRSTETNFLENLNKFVIQFPSDIKFLFLYFLFMSLSCKLNIQYVFVN